MIFNLTQHQATPEQKAAGVDDPANEAQAKRIRELLTFRVQPTTADILEKARRLAQYANQNMVNRGHSPKYAMIGGAPYLMAPLARELRALGIQPLYAFSIRDSVESTDAEGNVTKRAVFRHIGWVEAVE